MAVNDVEAEAACHSYTITPSTSTFNAMHAASVKMIQGAVIPRALVGKNGDPQTGWIKAGVLERTGWTLNSNNCLYNSGLICILLDVGLPKLVSDILDYQGLSIKRHLRGES